MEDPRRLEPLLVPVRIGSSGVPSLTVCRRPDGSRTGVAFSSPAALCRAMGEDQRHLRLSPAALRSMLADLGITAVQVDPTAVGRPDTQLRTAS